MALGLGRPSIQYLLRGKLGKMWIITDIQALYAAGLERRRCLWCDYLRHEIGWDEVVSCLAFPTGSVELALVVDELLEVLRAGCYRGPHRSHHVLVEVDKADTQSNSRHNLHVAASHCA